jgi:hypothetical protein
MLGRAVGEIFKPRTPRTPLGRDLIPIRHPLPFIAEEELRRKLEKARGFKLVCAVCGEVFTDLVEAWLHQERTGHKCFRIEAEIV